MGEIDEPRWAVISERGGEASGLTYQAALQLLRKLTQEKVYGTCIVTNEAANRLQKKSDERVPPPAAR